MRGDAFEIWKIVIRFGQWKVIYFAAVVAGVGAEYRIAWACHENDVSWVDEGGG